MSLLDSRAPVWLTEADCHLDEFRRTVERSTDPRTCPTAEAVVQGVPFYAAAELLERASGHDRRLAVQQEIVAALLDGPGIVAVRHAFAPAVVDAASVVFDALLVEERAAGHGGGDHFAKPGANERLWNALAKLALRAPEVFADYYANEVLALVCAAWLGPGYQVTSQVNVVNPGGDAQQIHRDYHLGFLTSDEAAAFPAPVHRLSALLTLQGAVAHCDMPLESGPTLYVPYSQRYAPGYLAWHLPEFQAYAAEHHVQLSLEKGDAVFFNPALFHAAGRNRSADVRRTANLVQASSPFGRAMESVDRVAVTNAVYPVLLERKRRGAGEAWLRNVVAACAEGYPFPTNLDRDVPIGGMAPAAPVALAWQALEEEWSPDALATALRSAEGRRAG